MFTSRSLAAVTLVLCLLSGRFCWAGNGPAFIQNQRQWPDAVRFKAEIPGGSVFLTATGFVYNWRSAADLQRAHEATEKTASRPRAALPDLTLHGHAVFVDFVGARAAVALAGQQQLAGYHNYFLGNDPRRWASRVPLFEEVRYAGLYAGTDLRVYGTADGSLKYDFVVQPGGQPADIALRYRGAERLRLRPDGTLLVHTSVTDVVEQRPYAYQVVGKQRRVVACRYQLEGNTLRYDFPMGYNPQLPLVIDPTVTACTYSGSAGEVWASSTAHDSQGNLYSGGWAFEGGYPVTPGAYQTAFRGTEDVAISKFSPDGRQLRYASYLGGPGRDDVLALAVTGADDLVLVASTNGAGFPTTAGSFSPVYNGGLQDLVVSKLSADGRQLLGSTYLGGSSDETFADVAVDAAGRIVVAGTTYSFNFPTTAGAFDRTRNGLLDGFVTCFAPDLTALAWSTLLGGQVNEIINDLALDSNGAPLLLGTTSSPDFPVSAGAFRPIYVPNTNSGFLTRLRADGSAVVASTFLFRDNLSGTAPHLALDAADNPYVLAATFDALAPTPGCLAAGGEVFVAKFDPSLQRQLLLARTELRFGLGVNAFEVDECENVHIAGVSYDNIPIVNPLPNSPTTITPNSSIARMFSLTLDARLARWTFGSFFGSLGHAHGRARFDKQGRLYANACVINGAGFPTTPGAYAATTRSGNARKDVVAYVLDQGTGPGPVVRAGAPAVPPGCAPYQVALANASRGSTRFRWFFGDGTPPDTARTPQHTYSQPGTYQIRLVAYGRGTGCSRNDTATAQVQVSAPVAAVLPRAVVLCGSQVTVDAGNPGASYQWSTGASTRTLNITQPGRYRVRIQNGGCAVRDSVDVRRLPLPALGPEQPLCPGSPLTLRPNAEPGSAFRWNTGALTPTLLVTQPGRYSVQITANGCTVRDSVLVRAVARPQLGPDTLVCSNAAVLLAPRGVAANSTFQWSTGETTPAITVQTPGTYSVRVTTAGCTQTLNRLIGTAPTELPPNIITPNHDGANDTFRPTAALPGTRLWVYNRWGREVYHSDNYANEWSAPGLPAGEYFYRLVNERLCEKQLKGWLHIVR